MGRKPLYDCAKCPAYCCSIYERVQVRSADLRRLAKHFGVTVETAIKRYTTTYKRERILRRKQDPIFGQACKFLDPQTRRCTIYEARPAVCRAFPDRPRCAYYDLIEFEREIQRDQDVIPVVKITFRDNHHPA
jgi:uncharacterized protein